MQVKIDLAAVERMTGRVGLKKVHELAELIIKKNLKGSIGYLAELNEDGSNIVQFTKDLVHYFRKVLSLKLNPGMDKVLQGELTSEEVANIKKLGVSAETEPIIKLLKSLIRGYSEMRYSPFASIPLEVALIENLS
jgi:DNA polymerase-3 subunit gamma/tau